MGNGSDEAIRSYRDLVAWQRAMALVELVYRCSSSFPADERFGLVSQIRRSAVSIPSNIAEGYGRGSAQDYQRFLRVARGSLFEVETQVIIAERLGYLTGDAAAGVREQIDSAAKVLSGLIRSLADRA
ncbi:MAG: four helix bundle protein [Planctomycetota bacterium]